MQLHFIEDVFERLFQRSAQNAICVVDSFVKKLYEKELSSLSCPLLTLSRGEKAKSEKTVKDLLNQLFVHNCTKDTTLFAIGGGATLDVCGFVSSIYLRGIPLISIPTTLVAMVDAAIGGKTAINTPYGKNLIGTFYLAKELWIDRRFFKTLPALEWQNGLAEVLKLALVYDASLWNEPHENFLEKAISAKLSIVRQDPYDLGLRRILNFGHTIAHALEHLSNYTLSHGQAVLIGTRIESRLSYEMGYLSHQALDEIEKRYEAFSLPPFQEYSFEALSQALSFDKKRDHKQVRFVLIEQIGHAVPFSGAYVTKVSEKALKKSYEESRNFSLHA